MEKEKDNTRELSFIIASDVLVQMFEGKNKGKAGELLDRIKEMDDKGMKIIGITPISSFLRAVFLADPNTSIQKIQKSLSFLKIIPGQADFKDEDAVMKELMTLATAISKEQNIKKD